MAKINLLPWREELRQQKKKEFLNTILLGVLATAFVMVLVHVYFNGQLQRQQGRNKILQNEIAQLDKQLQAIKTIEEKKARLLAKVDVIKRLQKSRPEIVHLFDEVPKIVPEGVYLTKFVQQGNELTFEGKSQSNARVSAMMNAIDASAWLHKPRLEIIRVPVKESPTLYSDFVLKARLGDDEPPPDTKAVAKTARAATPPKGANR